MDLSLHIPIHKPIDEPGTQPVITVQQPPHNTNEGSKFLDDAIRMREQPLMYTEESVAAGSPDNLI